MNTLDVPISLDVACDAIGTDRFVIEQVRLAVVATANSLGFSHGTIGVLITGDAAIHVINREHLRHDYPTDVISFQYDASGDHVEGELVASLDTAVREAIEQGWPPMHELLLYAIHGTLHICGLDDDNEVNRRVMRTAERHVLTMLGIEAVHCASDVHVGQPVENLKIPTQTGAC